MDTIAVYMTQDRADKFLKWCENESVFDAILESGMLGLTEEAVVIYMLKPGMVKNIHKQKKNEQLLWGK